MALLKCNRLNVSETLASVSFYLNKRLGLQVQHVKTTVGNLSFFEDLGRWAVKVSLEFHEKLETGKMFVHHIDLTLRVAGTRDQSFAEIEAIALAQAKTLLSQAVDTLPPQGV